MRIIWLLLACLTLLLLNYIPHIFFLCSFAAFLVISLFLKLAFTNNWIKRAGLKITLRSALYAAAALITLTTIIYFYITTESGSEGINFKSHLSAGNEKFYIFTLFQTLNEEIIIGALLLYSLTDKYPSVHKLLISVITAALFAAAHYFVYRFLFLERSIIEIPAIAALFMVGIIRNNLILRAGHVAYSWVLHLSWNLVFFGGSYTYLSDGRLLTQAALFNSIMGRPKFLGVSLIAAAVSSIILYSYHKS